MRRREFIAGPAVWAVAARAQQHCGVRIGVFTNAAAIILCYVAFASTPANAGPPFRTDDPEPVEFGHYEFYTFYSGTHVNGDTSGVRPGFELNYGLIPNGQFHIVAPLAFDSPAGGPSQFGIGDTELGFKYRFIQEDDKGWRP
jgi:subtilisin family serine protease